MKQEENAYGVQFTKFLAKLQNGAMATVLNADNYAVFAASKLLFLNSSVL